MTSVPFDARFLAAARPGAERPVEFLAEAQWHVEDIGSWEEFSRDRRARLAAEGLVQRLREIVSRLPEEYRRRYPDVAWKSIIGVGIVAAHEYQRIDHRVVWTALSEELPALLEQLAADLPEPLPLFGEPAVLGEDILVIDSVLEAADGASVIGRQWVKSRRGRVWHIISAFSSGQAITKCGEQLSVAGSDISSAITSAKCRRCAPRG